ncbi:unnamed protein product [Polarella glacialis]|uniref:Uncharacterized protein n=1 Tax=Polarella glacialis TaxID=89957 RepID=A0A813LK51_POLGL|nr:unnamed protein product [Polarella glacialis]
MFPGLQDLVACLSPFSPGLEMNSCQVNFLSSDADLSLSLKDFVSATELQRIHLIVQKMVNCVLNDGLSQQSDLGPLKLTFPGTRECDGLTLLARSAEVSVSMFSEDQEPPDSQADSSSEDGSDEDSDGSKDGLGSKDGPESESERKHPTTLTETDGDSSFRRTGEHSGDSSAQGSVDADGGGRFEAAFESPPAPSPSPGVPEGVKSKCPTGRLYVAYHRRGIGHIGQNLDWSRRGTDVQHRDWLLPECFNRTQTGSNRSRTSTNTDNGGDVVADGDGIICGDDIEHLQTT